MDYLIKMKYGMVKNSLTGNLEIEQMMETVKLSNGEYWVIVANRYGHWFAGSRRAKLRETGRGQIAFGGRAGISCELLHAKTSSGKPIQFLELIERPDKPFAVHYVLPVVDMPAFE
jgi:hypothetical protein